MKHTIFLFIFLPAIAKGSLVFSQLFPVNQLVPDADPAGLLLSQPLVNTGIGSIESITVTLDMTGGWNGDLYAYLAKENAPGIAVLLNRVGVVDALDPDDFGSSSAGFSVIFDDFGAGGDIHIGSFANGATATGIYEPDARTTSPFEVRASDERMAFLSNFHGQSGDGIWQLFVADLESGETSTLVRWGLTLNTSAIPEPSGSLVVAFLLASALTMRDRKSSRAD